MLRRYPVTVAGTPSTVCADGSPFGCDNSRTPAHPHARRHVDRFVLDNQPPGAARMRSPAIAQQHRHLLCGLAPPPHVPHQLPLALAARQHRRSRPLPSALSAASPTIPPAPGSDAASEMLSSPPLRSAAPTAAPQMGVPTPPSDACDAIQSAPCRSRHGRSCLTADNCSQAIRASCHNAPRRRLGSADSAARRPLVSSIAASALAPPLRSRTACSSCGHHASIQRSNPANHHWNLWLVTGHDPAAPHEITPEKKAHMSRIETRFIISTCKLYIFTQ